MSPRILITGANGHLGRRLLARASPAFHIRAIVRSDRARATILAASAGIDVRVIDYTDVDALTAAADGCDVAVHLVGILRERGGDTYKTAGEAPLKALVAAAVTARLARIVYPSILGADADSPNRCLASRGRCERMLLDSVTPALVLQLPMVLGEGDHASEALGRHARSALCLQFRAGSLEQPIDAADVTEALMQALSMPLPASLRLALAGPESLTRRALIEHAGRIAGCTPRIVSLPIGFGYAIAAACERLLPDPPLTRDMLGVLDHDDAIDPRPAAEALGISLTPLDQTLFRVLAHGGGSRRDP